MHGETTRRGFLVASTAVLGGCIGGGSQTTVPVPDGPVANAPIPDDPGQYDYEWMGSGDAPVTVTYFANWKCPHCADFSSNFLGTLVSEYVEPGDVAIQHRAMAYTSRGPWLGEDSPRAARAGLAVWHTDPDSYWQYHEHVMQNQGNMNDTWATTDQLVQYARDVGVSDIETVRTNIEDGTYDAAVRATTTAANEAGVSSTPTLVVEGEPVSALEESAVRETLDAALANV